MNLAPARIPQTRLFAGRVTVGVPCAASVSDGEGVLTTQRFMLLQWSRDGGKSWHPGNLPGCIFSLS